MDEVGFFPLSQKNKDYCTNGCYITNFMGHNLTIIVVKNILFKGSYGINTNVIHLLVSFEHRINVMHIV